MHELVAEHVIVVGVDAGEGHDDACPQPLGDAARSLFDRFADDVRLLEVRMVGVEHDRLSIEGVAEAVRVSRVPSLGEAAGVMDDQALGGIEVQVEVRRPYDPEVELLVLDLVATEILRCQRGRRSDEERTEQCVQPCAAGSERDHRVSPADEPRLKVVSSTPVTAPRPWGAKLVPPGTYLTGLHLLTVQSWTKVLRRRRFEFPSGPLCLTSDTVQRDTSGERAANVMVVTPHPTETPCASSEAQFAARFYR